MLSKQFRGLIQSTLRRSYATKTDPLQEKAMAERCIIINEEDQPIGDASKWDCHRIQRDGSLILHRAFSVFLFNSSGEFLVQQRSPFKVTFPNVISNSCCSHPIKDYPEELIETDAIGVKLAAIRRLNIELGVPTNELRFDDFHYLTRLHYKANDAGMVWGEHEITHILFLKKDLTIKINENDIGFVEYVKREDFPDYIKNSKYPMSPWFKVIANKYLLSWWDNLENLDKVTDHNNIIRIF